MDLSSVLCNSLYSPIASAISSLRMMTRTTGGKVLGTVNCVDLHSSSNCLISSNAFVLTSISLSLTLRIAIFPSLFDLIYHAYKFFSGCGFFFNDCPHCNLNYFFDGVFPRFPLVDSADMNSESLRHFLLIPA